MPSVNTRLFGQLEYEDDHVIVVRSGLPGLPHTQHLIPVSQALIEPFLFFQSIDDPGMALLAVPVAVANKNFRLHLSQEQRLEIECGTGSGLVPRGAQTLGAFALVSVTEDRIPTANLLAPLVICFANNLGIQAIQPVDDSYLRFPIEATVARETIC